MKTGSFPTVKCHLRVLTTGLHRHWRMKGETRSRIKNWNDCHLTPGTVD